MLYIRNVLSASQMWINSNTCFILVSPQTFRHKAHLYLCPPSLHVHPENIPDAAQHSGRWKHFTAHFSTHVGFPQRFCSPERKYPQRHRIFLSARLEKEPCKQYHTFCPPTTEWNENRRAHAAENLKPKPSWVYTKLYLICRWLHEDYKAPAVNGLNHTTTAIETDLPSWHLYGRAQWSIYAWNKTLLQFYSKSLWTSGSSQNRFLISEHGAAVRLQTAATL